MSTPVSKYGSQYKQASMSDGRALTLSERSNFSLRKSLVVSSNSVGILRSFK
jgi:hypothetical protein